MEVSLIVKWEQQASAFGEGFCWWLPRGSVDRGGEQEGGEGSGGGGEEEGEGREEGLSSLNSGVTKVHGLEPVHIREALRRWSAPAVCGMGSRGSQVCKLGVLSGAPKNAVKCFAM